VLSTVGDHILKEFNTLDLTRLRTYKIARPPKQKPTVGVPLHVNFLDDDILLWCLYS
jgi:hypothetical protein